MHDLNDALDELRHVIPYAHSPSVRKLSKIATLLLAKNYILMQTNALNELRRVLVCLHQYSGAKLPHSLAVSVANFLGTTPATEAPSLGAVRSGATSDFGRQPLAACLAPPPAASLEAWPQCGATAPAPSNHSNSAASGHSGAAAAKTPAKLPGATVSSGNGDDRQQQQQKQPPVAGQLQQQQVAQAAGGVSLQATSVQQRRHKYNMLINRILGDVASQQQQLIAGVGAFRPPVCPVQATQLSPISSSSSSPRRPVAQPSADNCEQNFNAGDGAANGQQRNALDPTKAGSRRGDDCDEQLQLHVPPPPPPHDRNLSGGRRKWHQTAETRATQFHKRMRAETCNDLDAARNANTNTTTLCAGNVSSASESASSCSSPVSVGSPIAAAPPQQPAAANLSLGCGRGVRINGGNDEGEDFRRWPRRRQDASDARTASAERDDETSGRHSAASTIISLNEIEDKNEEETDDDEADGD